MNQKHNVLSGLLLSLLLVAPIAFGSGDEDKEKVMAKQMNAISNNDHAAFIENGTNEFKAGISKSALTSVKTQVGDLIQEGYKSEYLAKLNQKGMTVYLWKISYEGSTENSLAKLVISNGKVAGFWLQ